MAVMYSTDMLGRQLTLKLPLQNIISVVPSQTELLYDLGLDEEVIGITKFCIHPAIWKSTKTIIGGTKNLRIEKILALKPGLIIANKEENTRADIEILEKECPVWISDIQNMADNFKMIQELGYLLQREEAASKIISEIRQNFDSIPPINSGKKTAYLIWNKPLMAVGRNNFIHSVIENLGWQNCFQHLDRYPEITLKNLQEAKLDLLLLSSEPYPFEQKHIVELKAHLPSTKIILVDGEMFSWYGSRMIKAGIYLKSLVEKIESF